MHFSQRCSLRFSQFFAPDLHPFSSDPLTVSSYAKNAKSLCAWKYAAKREACKRAAYRLVFQSKNNPPPHTQTPLTHTHSNSHTHTLTHTVTSAGDEKVKFVSCQSVAAGRPGQLLSAFDIFAQNWKNRRSKDDSEEQQDRCHHAAYPSLKTRPFLFLTHTQISVCVCVCDRLHGRHCLYAMLTNSSNSFVFYFKLHKYEHIIVCAPNALKKNVFIKNYIKLNLFLGFI